MGDNASQSYGTTMTHKDSESEVKTPLVSTKVSGLSIETCLKRYMRQNRPKTAEKVVEKIEKI